MGQSWENGGNTWVTGITLEHRENAPEHMATGSQEEPGNDCRVFCFSDRLIHNSWSCYCSMHRPDNKEMGA